METYLFLQVHALIDIAHIFFHLRTGFIGENIELWNPCLDRNIISILSNCFTGILNH